MSIITKAQIETQEAEIRSLIPQDEVFTSPYHGPIEKHFYRDGSVTVRPLGQTNFSFDDPVQNISTVMQMVKVSKAYEYRRLWVEIYHSTLILDSTGCFWKEVL